MPEDESSEQTGRGTGRLGPWADDDDDAHATRQTGDPHAADVEGDPRGGVQSEEYRRSEPRDVVTEGDVAMSGAGGAPQEGKSVEERRAESERWREEKFGGPGAGSPEGPA
ncbi:MAG: hypothetical protein M3322_02840 [Actinomycetota bacterium]|jgi:hypothetical protein|nr:hypothetical protein [Actinomycetota bacterium]